MFCWFSDTILLKDKLDTLYWSIQKKTVLIVSNDKSETQYDTNAALSGITSAIFTRLSLTGRNTKYSGGR